MSTPWVTCARCAGVTPGPCPAICPDHDRHCDQDQDHPGDHACPLCLPHPAPKDPR